MALVASCQRSDQTWSLESPDQSISVEIQLKDSGTSSQLFYAISRNIEGSLVPVMDPSPLGLVCKGGRFVEDLEFVSMEKSLELEDSYALVTGKQRIHKKHL